MSSLAKYEVGDRFEHTTFDKTYRIISICNHYEKWYYYLLTDDGYMVKMLVSDFEEVTTQEGSRLVKLGTP